MQSKKVTLALVACLALGALAAGGAQAAEGEGWTIGTTENQATGGTAIPNGTHERISCKKHGTSSLTITSAAFGAEISVGQVDCLEQAGSTNAATIDNTKSKGHSEGIFTFTNVKVLKPANCEVAHGELTTEPLTDEVIMDPTAGSTSVFDRFFPEAAAFGFVDIEVIGAACPIGGFLVVGTACGEFVHTNAAGTGYEPNHTGTLTKAQTLLFGSPQQTTGNSAAKPCALTDQTFKKQAQLIGAIDFELAGTNAGKPFGVD